MMLSFIIHNDLKGFVEDALEQSARHDESRVLGLYFPNIRLDVMESPILCVLLTVVVMMFDVISQGLYHCQN